MKNLRLSTLHPFMYNSGGSRLILYFININPFESLIFDKEYATIYDKEEADLILFNITMKINIEKI